MLLNTWENILINILDSILPSTSRQHSSFDELATLTTPDASFNGRQRSFSDSGGKLYTTLLFVIFSKIIYLGEGPDQDTLTNDIPPIPPRRSHRKSRNSLPKPISNGLPPTPKVHMGACFSKVFYLFYGIIILICKMCCLLPFNISLFIIIMSEYCYLVLCVACIGK